jgi:osmoprotectant transport system permease protein
VIGVVRLAALGSAALLAAEAGATELRVGSKKFTESVVLGEVLAHLARQEGGTVEHQRELGGTRILWNALVRGEIDAYPEYTGTIRREILAGEVGEGDDALSAVLAAHGIRRSGSLGFNNTYAIGMRENIADSLGVTKISDLREHPELHLGFTNEFMDRGDGWPGLREHYGLPHAARGLDHDLAYRGLESGTIQAMDLYSTDAEIRYYGLRVLEDDLEYFPEYYAVVLWRDDLAERAPGVVAAFRGLAGNIGEEDMVAMNARAKLDRVPEARIAADFLAEALDITAVTRVESAADRFLRHTREHLFLVGVSLLAAILLAIPLGIVAAKSPRLGQGILGVTGVIQTIPSLALLVFMIPLLGIGAAPAVCALFLYSLLPIVRNTYAGLHDVSLEIRESAEALGLSPGAILRLVELPMASRSILAGIKTSAVINVGTATLGALIGAGGYGQPILTGIRLDDAGLILQGAVPAAGLALLAQGFFELVERRLVPKGLRLEAHG